MADRPRLSDDPLLRIPVFAMFAVIFALILLLPFCGDPRPSLTTPETPTPTIVVVVLPTSEATPTARAMGPAHTQTPTEWLLLATALPTRTATPSPTSTVAPTETPVRTMVQKG